MCTCNTHHERLQAETPTAGTHACTTTRAPLGPLAHLIEQLSDVRNGRPRLVSRAGRSRHEALAQTLHGANDPGQVDLAIVRVLR
jgi:hypothetical protein